MKRAIFSAVAVACLVLATSTADAGPRHRHHRTSHAAETLITVSTAAGIDITVSPSFAPKIKAFIADAWAAGYRPKRIKCYSLSKSHVSGSRHFIGEACDFNQRGWNKTDRFMYRVGHIAARYGLRDGCSFRDCGHIDSGRSVAGRHRRQALPHYADAHPPDRFSAH